ncbi:PaaI family thioesterase [Bradyrhizobium sp. RDT10]
MRDTTKTTASHGFDLHVGTEGEFVGWRTWSNDYFFAHTGPFWQRQEPDGSIRCAFRVEKKHLNGTYSVHGGCLMTFADYCLFAIASTMLQGPAVTVNFAADFIDIAHEGDLIVGTGEIIRAGGSLIFVRGQLTAGERILLTFSGTMKRLKRAAIPQPSSSSSPSSSR